MKKHIFYSLSTHLLVVNHSKYSILFRCPFLSSSSIGRIVLYKFPNGFPLWNRFVSVFCLLCYSQYVVLKISVLPSRSLFDAMLQVIFQLSIISPRYLVVEERQRWDPFSWNWVGPGKQNELGFQRIHSQFAQDFQAISWSMTKRPKFKEHFAPEALKN